MLKVGEVRMAKKELRSNQGKQDEIQIHTMVKSTDMESKHLKGQLDPPVGNGNVF